VASGLCSLRHLDQRVARRFASVSVCLSRQAFSHCLLAILSRNARDPDRRDFRLRPATSEAMERVAAHSAMRHLRSVRSVVHDALRLGTVGFLWLVAPRS
jgi:hypothetical protein